MTENAPRADDTETAGGDMPFLSHLVELRDRLLRVVLAVVLIFLCLFYFANDLYTMLAEPLMRHLPDSSSMIATEVAAPFLTPFKLTLVLSIFLAMPVVLYQAWGFIAPGLYKHEQRLVYPLLISSVFLFYLGMTFAYYVVFPLVFGFLTSVAPDGVTVMTDMSRYLDFVLKLFFAFGIAFEVPIATILLVKMGMTTPESLAAKRPYIIVGAFVIGMLLTPPDIISQTLLALPMWVLFEIGLFFSRAIVAKDSGDEDDDPVESAAETTKPSGTAAAAAAAAAAYARDHQAAEPDDAEQEMSEEQRQALEDDLNFYDDEDEEEEEEDYEEMSDEEMEAELDRIEAEEEADDEGEEESRDDPDTAVVADESPAGDVGDEPSAEGEGADTKPEKKRD